MPNGIIVEGKGEFTGADRTKHILVRASHPELDVRFVFMANNTLSKQSTTTYGEWCDKNGFMWAVGSIPPEWAKEKGSGKKIFTD